MQAFTTVRGIAVPMPVANIDTDQIVPKQFLKTISREGLGAGLFYDSRFDGEGKPIAGFILDRAPYDKATILVAGDNFGCGSSREHAPWALLDFGIRAMISTSFADIFNNNSINNGLLPVVLPEPEVAVLMLAAQAGAEITVDLERCTVTAPPGLVFGFEIDPPVRAKLLAGLDAIDESLMHATEIDAIEGKLARAMPWLPKA